MSANDPESANAWSANRPAPSVEGADQPTAERRSRRARREQPLLIVNTGTGKGKSTASFGLLQRAWAQGWRCGVYQFVKSGKWRTGEELAARVLSESSDGGTIDWFKQGDGWTWTSRDLEESADLAREGWAEVRRRIGDATYRFLLLDEFTYPMTFGWVDTAEVVATLTDRPGFQHVVVSGRSAPPELVEVADLVSDVTKVKHPFETGQRGQKGIEW